MMSRTTGRWISTLDHIKQSIQDILTTPIETRTHRRGYGSLLPKLIDAPLNQTTLLQVQAACATAILQQEDRVTLDSLTMNTIANGKAVIDLKVQLVEDNTSATLQIPLQMGAAT